MTSRLVLLTGALGGLLAVGVLVAPDGLDAWVRAALIAATAAAIHAGVVRHRPARAGVWWLLWATMVAFVVDSVLIVVDAPGVLAEVVALSGLLLLVATAVLFVRRLDASGAREGAVDGAIVAIAFASVAGVLLVRTELVAVSEAALAHAALGPVVIALIAGAFTRFALVVPERCPSAWLLLAAVSLSLVGTLARAAAVSLGAGYEIGSPADALIIAAYPLVALAAVHPSMVLLADAAAPPTTPDRGRLRLVLLGLALLLPPALLALDPPAPGRDVAIAAAAVVNVLALWRLARLFSDRERVSAALSEQVARDPLTGLANRRAFVADLDRTRARCRREGAGLAVLFCDLDAFKPVNDRHGHAVGDAVLVETARRLEAATREGDLVARIAGDEFVVMLPAVDPAAVAVVEARIRAVVAEPFDVDGHTVRVGVSVGVAHVAASAEADPDVDPDVDLVAEADRAMYRDKRGRALAT
ncbi:MAG: GGDEF domain-containing protein [Egibacteraceae bacterium]